MAAITIRKNEPATTPAAREYEPFRAMRELLRWDPFKEMTPLFPTELAEGFVPAFEVKENAEAFVFKADVPGVKEGDLEINVTGNRLNITGTRREEKEEKEETWYACERKYGAFTRVYTLPEGADVEHIAAELKAGVLTVAVPKLPELKPKKVAVKETPTKA